MSNIIFSESSGLNDSVFGKCQMPIKMFLEERGEAFQQTSILKDLFLMGTSENFADLITSMTAMDGFQPVGENGAYPTDGMQEGYSKHLVYQTWKDSFAISRELIEDGKLLDLKKRPAAFMTSYGRTRELFGAALYGGAIGGASSVKFRGRTFDITGADGKPLFNTGHKAKVKGADQSNKFSDAFSVDALSAVETEMQQFKGDNDNELDVTPDTILIPNIAGLKKDVFAAIASGQSPENGNNAYNYQYGRWNVIIWPYLNRFVTSGTAPWILLDSKYNQTYGGAVWNDRVQLEVRSTIDDNTDANVWRGRSRFNGCFNDWRFAAIGGVTGGTTLLTTT